MGRGAQLLEMVDGGLEEVRPIAAEVPEGQIVRHRVLSLSHSRRAIAAARAPPPAAPPPLVPSAPPSRNPPARQAEGAAPRGDTATLPSAGAARARDQAVQDRALGEAVAGVAAQEERLRGETEGLHAQRAALQAQQEELVRRSSALRRRTAEVAAREAEAAKAGEELRSLAGSVEQRAGQLRAREDAQRSGASQASASATVREGEGGGGGSAEDAGAMGKIEFAELTLGALLGSGSFADVYRAEWRMPCAVKKMKGISREQAAEFVREGELMRSIKHPSIVKLLGICLENGACYLVQELVRGPGNIFDYLHKRHARFSYWQVLRIACGISDAMAYLHDRHIVHRDLKPHNCLLVNETGEIKLCDFGLARLKSTNYVETVSNTAGTPAYQSPEMLRDEPITEKVDLYGFGIMLWQMFTGKLPWSDKNYPQMVNTVAVRNERPPIGPEMPRELAQVIEECWHPQPQRRPRFQDLKSSLPELLAAVPQQILEPPPPLQAPAAASRHPAPHARADRQPPAQREAAPRAHGAGAAHPGGGFPARGALPNGHAGHHAGHHAQHYPGLGMAPPARAGARPAGHHHPGSHVLHAGR